MLAARAYAHDSLRLETGQSFTTYSRLDRDTLVLLLSGAYRDKLRVPHLVVSRGRSSAVQGLLRLRRGARRGARPHRPTASTPGSAPRRHSAPSAGSTTRSCPRRCAPIRSRSSNTVIHELTHNTFYAPGGAVFNESFANFAGSRGAERFFHGARAGRRGANRRRRWEDEKLIGRFWASLYARVDSAFEALPGEEPRTSRSAHRRAGLDLREGARRPASTRSGRSSAR